MKKFNAIREESLLEKLKSSDPAGKWIHDFVHSDNPKFAGKSKKERIRMALGASYGAKRNEEIEYHFNMLEEAVTSIDKGEYDYEGQMARTQLQTILRNSTDLIEMISNSDNMPEWVQSKITLAQDYISSVRDYLQSKGELGEEVEQIDELSKSTLGSYTRAAALDLTKRSFSAGQKSGKANWSDNPEHRKWDITRDKDKEKTTKRVSGITKASIRMANEEAEQLDEYYTVHPHDENGRPKPTGMPTKFYTSAMSTAIKHNKEGRTVTVRVNDHKGEVDSTVIKPGEHVKSKMETLKDKRVDESIKKINEADIYSIKNTKTGQLYHTSKYPITSSNRKYQQIKSAGGDHEHATIHMNGKPLKTDTSNSKPSETKPVKTSNPPKSTLDKPKTATDFAKGVVSSTASSLLASKRKTDESIELDEDERLKVLRSNISTRKTAKTSPTRPKTLTGFVKGVASSTASNLMGSRRKVTEQMRPPKGEKEYRYPEGGGTGGGTFRGRVEPTLGPEPTMNQGRMEPSLGARLPKDIPPSKTNMGRIEPTLDKSKKTNEDSQLDQLKTMRKDPQHTSNPDHASQLDRRIKMAQDRHDLDKGEVTDKTGKPVQVLPPADFAKKNPNFNKEEHVAEATGDPKFDNMLKGVTGKRQVAKQQKADTKQQARDAFGSMFGGGNPGNSLGIRKKSVAEADNSTTMNTPSKDHIGTGESPDMQMAVDMAKAQARMKALQSIHGTSFQDKPMPNHEFGKLDVQSTGKGYKVNAPLKMLETKELQMQMLDEISNKIKIKVNMPKPTKAEIAQAKYRKEKGLPNPSQYKTMAVQKQKEIDDMKSEATKPGLYANIHAKRKRIAQGSGERMRKPGTKGSPTAQSFKDAAKTAKK
jgi:hypothetical protein